MKLDSFPRYISFCSTNLLMHKNNRSRKKIKYNAQISNWLTVKKHYDTRRTLYNATNGSTITNYSE